MKKKTTATDASKILEVVANGLIDENNYYHCEISSDWSVEDGSLIETLSNALWVNPVDDPLSKKEQRGLSVISQLKSSAGISHALVVGILECYVTREEKTEVEIDGSYPEKDVNIKDMPLRMSTSEYQKLLHDVGTSNTVEKSLAPVVIRCKTLPQVPKCNKCDGTGRGVCGYCHGYGDCECPDCKGRGELFPDGKLGEEHWFRNKIGYYIHERKVLSMDECPSCKGTGEFHCDVCGGKGEVSCEDCKGSGKMKNGKIAQKVTRMQERYDVYVTGSLVIPNGQSFEVNPFMMKEEIISSIPIFMNGHKDSEEVERTLMGCSKSTHSEITSLLLNEGLYALHVVTHKLDKVCSISFVYNSNEYQILVIGDKAFAKELPEISSIEKFLGTYKKKMS